MRAWVGLLGYGDRIRVGKVGWHRLAGWDGKGIRRLWDWVRRGKGVYDTPRFVLNHVASGAL